MASSIDPDKKANRVEKPGESGAALAKPAAANPGAARPAKARPAPKAPPARQPQQPRRDDQSEEEAEPAVGAKLLKQTPAWAVSMVVHIVVFLAMALIATEPLKKEAVVSIVSTAADEEVALEELNDDLPDSPVENTDPVTDVAVTTDVGFTTDVVEDVQVVVDSQDLDAAPLAVEMTDIGDISVAPSEMMSTIGAVGGKETGFGSRKKGAALAGGGGGGGGNGLTQSAVDRALKWFIEHQCEDGGWDFNLVNCPKCQGACSTSTSPRLHKPNSTRVAATALALLPFLGRGYTHKEGPYQQELEKGIMYLARWSEMNQGNCCSTGNMYSQGIASIALSEAYGMTEDERLAMPAQLAISFIENAQDPTGGGWKYKPREPGDTSVFGWQFMALKSGHLSNLQITPAKIKLAVSFLDSVEYDSGVKYRYEKNGPDDTTTALTAIGLLCRMYSGWERDHPALERGVNFLAATGPTRDMYGNYYATQVMHHYGGDQWLAWDAKMKALLLPTQASEGHLAGSWYNADGVADPKAKDKAQLFARGGTYENAEYGGRLYVTSLATMMLEVYYRHMRIYTDSVREGNP